MKQAHGGAPLCVIPVSHYTKTKSVCNFHLLIDDTACLIFSYPIGLFKAICLLINSSLHRPISFRLICIYLILMYLSNVTRFGEISPLWQHFNRLWENFDMVLIWYLVNFWNYFENFYANVSNFNYINGQILKNHIAIWSHCICTFVSIRRRRIDLFNSHLLVDDAAEVLTWRGAQDSQDVVKLIQVVLAGKDRSVRQHFSQDATHGPDIDGLCVALK